MTVLLEATRLTKRFGDFTAVREASLAVEAGSTHAVIGPNGAGKSTLFGLLSGLEPVDAGTVRLDGREITALGVEARAEAGLARTFQHATVFAGLTAAQNVRVALAAHAKRHAHPWRREAGVDDEAIERALLLVGLGGKEESRAADLAYGDRKLLELAMALALRPRLLLLDEPTAGLSPPETAHCVALVRRLVAEEGVTLLFTEHDMEVVFGLARTVTVLEQGAVLAVGTPAEVQADPRVRASYLGRH